MGDGRPSAGISKLLEMRSFEDADLGIAERFLTPTIGGGTTVAVLSTPLGAAHDLGWVVCHAFGLDQINLQPFEVPLARELAAAGFPVLRYHAQGFGDSELSIEHVGLASMVECAIQAAALLRDEAGVTALGTFGARLGGTVAAMAGERAGASALALWDPVVRGRTYTTRLARFSSTSELVTRGRAQIQARNPMDVLRETGAIDVQGVPLPEALFDELSAIELTEAVTRFRGRSLVVQPSRSGQPRSELESFVGHLSELGGEAALEIVTDPLADKLGQPRFVGVDGVKVDELGSLARSLNDVTLSWCRGLVEDRS
jgi:pimeloyl-ACP methyl ester carboxylesterase